MRVAVVGAGVVGLASAAALIPAGIEVDCYEPGRLMGARSAGSTRIFRLAHADAQLVRAAQRARQRFQQWSEQAARPMLVNSQCVVSGADMTARADAMAEAGAEYELVGATSDRLRLPVRRQPSAALIDVGGGVVDVDAVRAYLASCVGESVIHEPVRELEVTSSGSVKVTAAGGAREYDAAVLAAGVNTTHLAAQVGIYTPSTNAHHVRFTFRVEDRDWQSWIDKPTGGFGTYQHRAGPGLWAIGGNVDPALERWEVGREGTIAASREAVVDYVATHLVAEPTIVESLYCTKVPDLGDGVQFRRNGPVITVYGDNLMKFAPILGDTLAEAVVSGSTPTTAELALARPE